MRIITREEVAQKLRDWMDGRLASDVIHAWANSVYMSDGIDYSDWERDEDSVTNEVVAALDMLDMNLVTSDDAPIYLDFLLTPAGEFRVGYPKMKERIDAIDYDPRRLSLRKSQPYPLFLRSVK